MLPMKTNPELSDHALSPARPGPAGHHSMSINRFLIKNTAVAALGGLLFGFDADEESNE
jgi:hypothetical protein